MRYKTPILYIILFIKQKNPEKVGEILLKCLGYPA